MTVRRLNPVLLTVLLACLTLLVSGCVNLPVSGPVKAGPSVAGTDEAPYDFNPAGPRPKETPVEIVGNFLLAMQATPQSTSVARQFLTSESRANWSPSHGAVIYGSYTLAAGAGSVTVRLTDTARLDAGGHWLGAGGHGGRLALHLKMVKAKGQWRISHPPNVLIIPQSHFEARFQQFNLYFFDQSSRVLVPEPVYLPAGDQAPTLLVKDLLHGPGKGLSGSVRTFIPPRTRLDDLSVPVSGKGVATVSLSAPMLGVAADERQLAFAELGWTLAQVSGIDRMKVLVNGSPLEVPGQGSAPSVDAWSGYDPAVSWASPELYGLRRGRVESVANGAEQRVPGVFPPGTPSVRSIGVSLNGSRVAGVTADGSSALVSRTSQPGQRAGSSPATAVYTGGTDLLRPAWDLYGQTWLVDRTSAGAVLVVVRDGKASEVQAPGISGNDVTAFSLSRDGTRLAAVVAGHGRPGAEHLVLARVRRDHTGRVTSLGQARDLPVTAGQVFNIRDITWYSPTTVAVLVGAEQQISQVYLSRVDGSSGFVASSTSAELFRGRADRVVTSPSPGTPLYLENPVAAAVLPRVERALDQVRGQAGTGVPDLRRLSRPQPPGGGWSQPAGRPTLEGCATPSSTWSSDPSARGAGARAGCCVRSAGSHYRTVATPPGPPRARRGSPRRGPAGSTPACSRPWSTRTRSTRSSRWLVPWAWCWRAWSPTPWLTRPARRPPGGSWCRCRPARPWCAAEVTTRCCGSHGWPQHGCGGPGSTPASAGCWSSPRRPRTRPACRPPRGRPTSLVRCAAGLVQLGGRERMAVASWSWTTC